MDAEALAQLLCSMCLDPHYRGYKHSYGPGLAAQAGLRIEELDEVYAREGEDGFRRAVREGAERHLLSPAQFVRHLDEIGVEWGITNDPGHDNRKTAELVSAFPQKLKGFIFVDPHRGQAAVEELERWVYGPGGSRGSRKVSDLGSSGPSLRQIK